LLQTHKLLTSVIFARAKGYTRALSAAELEMMNLTGDGTRARHGDDAATDARAGSASNFFQRGYGIVTMSSPVPSPVRFIISSSAALSARV